MKPTGCACVISLALLVGLAGCGSPHAPSREVTGATARANRQLRDYGLTKAQAACMVDQVGAEVVNEATDLTALTQGGAYQDAAKECIDAT